MRIADLTTGASQLRDALDALRTAWAETRQNWDDENSRNIAENHLAPIAREVAAAFPAIQNLASALAQAERDCEPWQ